ncbi:hypothetical protein U1Q18_038531 [Sarracenia purpurea var. burkii]
MTARCTEILREREREAPNQVTDEVVEMRLQPSVFPSRRREAMDCPGAAQTDRNVRHRLVRAGDDQARGGQEDRPTVQ